MDILYRQAGKSWLSTIGVTHCYLKWLSWENDGRHILKKPHYHTGFEVHIVNSGEVDYVIGDECIHVSAAQMLIIPPHLVHTTKNNSPDMAKYTLTFIKSDSQIKKTDSYIHVPINDVIRENLSVIANDKTAGGFKTQITELRLLECIMRILFLVGEKPAPSNSGTAEADVRFMLAKEYIEDNIFRSVSVPEVAAYCCISSKQLTRIFLSEAGICVSEYIRRARCSHIESLLLESRYSLKEISDIMSFSSEYYFNVFFKKHAGMSPGAYRKSFKK